MEESTLCWKCQNAVPDKGKGCSWSRRFEPVEGWEAEKRYFTLFTGAKTVTYKVLECPQFNPDVQRTPKDIVRRKPGKIQGEAYHIRLKHIESDIYGVDNVFIVYKQKKVMLTTKSYEEALRCNKEYKKSTGRIKWIFKVNGLYYTAEQLSVRSRIKVETIKSKVGDRRYDLIFANFKGVVE